VWGRKGEKRRDKVGEIEEREEIRRRDRADTLRPQRPVLRSAGASCRSIGDDWGRRTLCVVPRPVRAVVPFLPAVASADLSGTAEATASRREMREEMQMGGERSIKISKCLSMGTI
jgi:hypothetical protein